MTSPARPLQATKSAALKGCLSVPGDKSISHRALLLGALATGKTQISGLLESTDILATANALRAMGVPITQMDGIWEVTGRSIGGLTPPETALDFGNSGTGIRLMMGILAGQGFSAKLIGDESLSRRPMGRVLDPLKTMGLLVTNEDNNRLPLTICGTSDLLPISYDLPVASAQVKSAILLAGLHAQGQTSVCEKVPTRDHTERMLRFFGATIETKTGDEKRCIAITGEPTLRGQNITVPGDPSSAAFLTAAALIVPQSEITLQNILMNPTRTGFFETLIEMGAPVNFVNIRQEAGEQVANIQIKYGPLKGVTVPATRAPAMIDEYPILAALAAYADGTTRMEGLAELRVKESDRLAATKAGLDACKVPATIEGDTLIVEGQTKVPGGGTVQTHMDHRIAMSFLTLGFGAEQPVSIDDGSMIRTSFPSFTSLMRGIGAQIHEIEAAS